MKGLWIVLEIFIILISTAHCKRLTEAQKKSLEESKKCRLAENSTVHPLDCCNYPRFLDATPQILKDCDINCRMLPYPLFSCVRNCIIERYGVFTRTNGGFVTQNRIVDAFWDQDEVAGTRPLPQIWRNVVYNSSLICFSEFPLSPFNDGRRNVSNEDSWNYYYMNYVECIRKRNFLECNLKDIPECNKLKMSIMHCHQPDYGFLHHLFFEEFYYRNRTEKARLKKLKDENKPDLYEESHKNDPTPPRAIEESTTDDSTTEIKNNGDMDTTQNSSSDKAENESSTAKNLEENEKSSLDSSVTGTM